MNNLKNIYVNLQNLYIVQSSSTDKIRLSYNLFIIILFFFDKQLFSIMFLIYLFSFVNAEGDGGGGDGGGGEGEGGEGGGGEGEGGEGDGEGEGEGNSFLLKEIFLQWLYSFEL